MNNFTIDVVGFVNPHKVVVQRNAFSTLANVHEMKMFKKIRTKRATSGGLKQPFSQVEKKFKFMHLKNN